MNTPIFIHICADCDRKMNTLWNWMRFYPGAVKSSTDHTILISGLMYHVFLTGNFEFEKLAGIEIKGFDIEPGAILNLSQYELLQSRVRQ